MHAKKCNALTVAKHFTSIAINSMQKRACIFIGKIKMHTILIAIKIIKYLAKLILSLFHNDVNLLRSLLHKTKKGAQ